MLSEAGLVVCAVAVTFSKGSGLDGCGAGHFYYMNVGSVPVPLWLFM